MHETEANGQVNREIPTFGIIDLVDAFTAFRHEYRTFVKESRSQAEALEKLSGQLEQIAITLQSQADAASHPTSHAISLNKEPDIVQTLIQFDIQWTRAIEVVQRSERAIGDEVASTEGTFEAAVNAMSPFRRWLAKPLIHHYRRLLATTRSQRSTEAMTEGLNMVLARLRQTLEAYNIERLETLGRPFDGQVMRSISSVIDPRVPCGHVAQELTPAYLRNGTVLKYADVRVATDSK